MSTLLVQFLTWVDTQPRSYAETMDAWRSSCPRFPVWEDALADHLIEVEAAGGVRQGDRRVTLTPEGRTALHEERLT